MAQIINTNVASLNAQRNLNRTQRENETALQRLSSGLRINSARDDAAGLAISSRFETQIRGSNQAIRNSGDAISLSQTAEGALSSISLALQRIRELALQAANDTNTSLDRQALQEEVSQLKEEIQIITDTANFNGRKVLDGSFDNATFQVGSNVGETVSFSIGQISDKSLGAATSSGVSSSNRTEPIVAGATSDELTAGDLVINGFSIQASVGSDDSSSSLEPASSAIAKVAAINKSYDLTGVNASVDTNYVKGSTTATNNPTSVDLTINGVAFNLQNNTDLTVVQNMNATASAINAEAGVTGVRAEAGDFASQGVTLISEDGRNIAISSTEASAAADGKAQALGLLSSGTSTASADVYIGTYTLVSEVGENIELSSANGLIDRAGFEEGIFSGVNAIVVSDGGSTANNAALNTGDLILNGVVISGTSDSLDNASSALKSSSAIAKSAAINKQSDSSGVTAEVLANRLYSGTIVATSIASTVVINGVSIAISFASADDVDIKLKSIVDAVNNSAGQTGVRAESLDGDSFILVGDDGRNITMSGGTNLTELSAQTFVSGISLRSGNEITITTNTNAIENSGFRLGVFGGGEKGSLIKDLNISNVDGANAAIIAVDNALQTVSTIAAKLGAIQNRFESVIANLETRSENLSAANSRILDADFAAETASLTRTQVLQQAGITVLSQANARPQQVLSLLQQ